ncbi:MAG: LytTR family DNA-binding domain-containing protein [Bacteroidota bacterium]
MMRCIAIDDEPLALSLLKDNIERIPFLDLVGTCNDVFEAMSILEKNQIDLIFIDIHMPGLSGLEYIKSLPVKPLVIFNTAYEKYATEGYDLDIVDYLVKPVSMDRFLRACQRAKNQFVLKTGKNDRSNETNKDYFFVNSDYSLVKVQFDDIIWLQGYGDYVKFHLKGAEFPLVVRTSFKSLETELPNTRFIRIHKSYIISVNTISAIKKNTVFLGNKEFVIGEAYRENVEKLIKG